MKKVDKYVGELGEYKVYQNAYGGGFYAVDSSTDKFVLSGDTYCEVFDELAYLILEEVGKRG